MYEQAVIPIQDEKTFTTVHQSMDEAFAPARVEQFLRRLAGARLRVRQFEQILAHGFLGPEAPKSYAALSPSDQGQIRERYLRRVEQVAPEVRQKYFKVYASY